MTKAAKRYTRWFIFWMLVYSVSVIASVMLNNRFDFQPELRVALALSPVLPSLMALREFVIFIRGMDEVQSRIQTESLLISMGVVGFVTFAWGFAEGAVDLPTIPMFLILPGMITVWSIAQIFVKRRYQ